jgi:hypothetical protein
MFSSAEEFAGLCNGGEEYVPRHLCLVRMSDPHVVGAGYGTAMNSAYFTELHVAFWKFGRDAGQNRPSIRLR